MAHNRHRLVRFGAAGAAAARFKSAALQAHILLLAPLPVALVSLCWEAPARGGELALFCRTGVWHRRPMWPPWVRFRLSGGRHVFCDGQLGREASALRPHSPLRRCAPYQPFVPPIVAP